MGAVAKRDRATNFLGEFQSEGSAKTASSIVVAFLAEAFELQRASFLGTEPVNSVFHFRDDFDQIQINACEFGASLDEAAQLLAEHRCQEYFG